MVGAVKFLMIATMGFASGWMSPCDGTVNAAVPGTNQARPAPSSDSSPVSAPVFRSAAVHASGRGVVIPGNVNSPAMIRQMKPQSGGMAMPGGFGVPDRDVKPPQGPSTSGFSVPPSLGGGQRPGSTAGSSFGDQLRQTAESLGEAAQRGLGLNGNGAQPANNPANNNPAANSRNSNVVPPPPFTGTNSAANDDEAWFPLDQRPVNRTPNRPSTDPWNGSAMGPANSPGAMADNRGNPNPANRDFNTGSASTNGSFGNFNQLPSGLQNNASQPNAARNSQTDRSSNNPYATSSSRSSSPLASNQLDRRDYDRNLTPAEAARLPENGYSYNQAGIPMDIEGYLLNRFGERIDEDGNLLNSYADSRGSNPNGSNFRDPTTRQPTSRERYEQELAAREQALREQALREQNSRGLNERGSNRNMDPNAYENRFVNNTVGSSGFNGPSGNASGYPTNHLGNNMQNNSMPNGNTGYGNQLVNNNTPQAYGNAPPPAGIGMQPNNTGYPSSYDPNLNVPNIATAPGTIPLRNRGSVSELTDLDSETRPEPEKVATQTLFNALLLVSFVANLYLMYWLNVLRLKYQEMVAAKRAAANANSPMIA